MTGRLFLHIGPPKTATTALQYAFEELSNETLIYGGTFQPREERNTGSLSDILRQAAGGGRPAQGGRQLEDTLNRIRDEVCAGRIVVISEEMLTLSMPVPMADKLAFLGRCFKGLPTTIILCIRDPLEAIPSLYQEIYSSQPFLTKLSFARFCRSDTIDCYDYQKVVTVLQDAGFDTIRIIDFEQVCSGNLTSRSLFDHPGVPDRRLSLRKVNTGQVKDNSTIRALEPISLRMIGQTRIFRKFQKLLLLGEGRAVDRLAALAELIRIPNSTYRKLSIPEAELRHYSRSYQDVRRLAATCLEQVNPIEAREPV